VRPGARLAAALALAELCVLGGVAAAQEGYGGKGFGAGTVLEDPLTTDVAGPAQAVPAGGVAEVTVTLRVERPWHLYAHDFTGTGVPVALALDEAPGLSLESVSYPPASVVRDEPLTGETLRLLEGTTRITARLLVAEDHAPGPATATLRLDYQTCTDTRCLLPAQAVLPVAFEVRAARPDDVLGAPPPAQPAGPAPADSADAAGSLQRDFDKALAAGDVGTFLGLCVALALLSLLTPCVFPMIPITVSFFAKRGANGGGGTRYALAYGAGIVLTYTGFGVGMAAALGASSLQSVATNPWVNLAIGALFVFFGLSLMGFYDLRPPAFLARRAEAGVDVARGGYLPVLLMGFVFTVTAFTCTAPIVGTLLAALTTGGSLPLIVLGMLVYSLAFALPFVLLAMFPGMLAALPGAGGWMVTVKAVMGFLELVAALKFLSAADLVWNLELLPRPTLLLLAALPLAVLALYLLGVFRLPHDVGAPPRRISGRTLVAVGALLAALYFSRGLTGRDLDSWTESFLPPANYAGAGGAHAEKIAWHDDLATAKAAARAAGRPLFIDFTGVTCNNCRKVEKSIFSQDAFAQAVTQRAVPVRLYTDRQAPPDVKAADAANRLLMEQLGSVTLPLYVLMDTEGEVLRLMGYEPALEVQDFIDFMEVPR
jgi:thiol:disulfide interchange protein DsbD